MNKNQYYRKEACIGHNRYRKLLMFMEENGFYPDDDVTEYAKTAEEKKQYTTCSDYKEKVYDFPPVPIFREPDDFAFPPNSPERKRLEEVRKNIRERWHNTETRSHRKYLSAKYD